MPLVKVLGVLVLVAVACRAVLILLLGHPPGISFGGVLSLAAGGGLLIFAASAIAAGIAAYMARGEHTEYPGVTTGVIVALATTVLMYFTGS
jgi:hypothetical protein